MGGQKDVDSTNFEIYYKDVEVAYGHLNNRTNFAHVSMIEQNDGHEDIEDFLVEGIESRSLNIN